MYCLVVTQVSAAQPAPTCRDCVGSADDADVEHRAHPELAANKGAEGDANEEALSLEARGVGDHGHEEHGGCEHEHDDGVAHAWAQHVQDRAHAQTAHDGAHSGQHTG